MDIGQLMPQIVDIVHRDKVLPVTGRRWRLSRLGDSPLDESMTLNDSSIHDGEVLLLTAVEPSSPEWVACDPSHALARRGSGGEGLALRMVPPICCVLLGALGAATLAWSAARTAPAAQIITGTCIAVAAAAGAVVVRRLRQLAVPLSLVAVIFTAAVGFRAVPPGPPGTDLLLPSAAVFSVTILLLRLTGCGRTCLTTIATVSALIGAVAAAVVMWRLQPNAGRRGTRHDVVGGPGFRTQAVNGAQRHRPVDTDDRRRGRGIHTPDIVGTDLRRIRGRLARCRVSRPRAAP